MQTDLYDGEASTACAERVKHRGTATDGATNWYDAMIYEDAYDLVVNGVVQHIRELRLELRDTPNVFADPKDGWTREDQGQDILLLHATSTDSMPAPFGLGRYENAPANGAPFTTTCSAFRESGVGGGAVSPQPTATVTITSRTAQFFEGTVETPQPDGSMRRLTFHARSAPLPKVAQICCLKNY